MPREPSCPLDPSVSEPEAGEHHETSPWPLTSQLETETARTVIKHPRFLIFCIFRGDLDKSHIWNTYMGQRFFLMFVPNLT